LPVKAASRSSEKPSFLARSIACRSCGSPSARITASAARISAMRSRNQGAILVMRWASATLMPARIACATLSSRSAVGFAIAARIASGSSDISTSSRPERPVSIER
jgi:hypothetical protein